jgi:hypothetical protein
VTAEDGGGGGGGETIVDVVDEVGVSDDGGAIVGMDAGGIT